MKKNGCCNSSKFYRYQEQDNTQGTYNNQKIIDRFH